jgi:hypothetical protein
MQNEVDGNAPVAVSPPRRRLRVDRVVPVSMIPLLPRYHREKQMVASCVPVFDKSGLPSHVLELVAVLERRRLELVSWVWACGIIPRPIVTDEQCVLRAALRQHWIQIIQGKCPTDEGICTVEFSDQSVGLTKDTNNLGIELAYRANFQCIVSATDVTLPTPIADTERDVVPHQRLVSTRNVVSMAGNHRQSQMREMERQACLMNLVRLRTGSEPAPEPHRPYKVSYAVPSDRRTAFSALCGPIDRGDDAHLVDSALLFCVERPDNPYMTSLLMMSEINARLDADVCSSRRDVWRIVLRCLTELTKKRLISLYEIGRAERDACRRIQVADATRRKISWYCATPLPSDVISAIARLPEWQDVASEQLQSMGLDNWSRFEQHVIRGSGIIGQLAAQRDSSEAKGQCIDIIRSFINQHGRTMRPTELSVLLPRV